MTKKYRVMLAPGARQWVGWEKFIHSDDIIELEEIPEEKDPLNKVVNWLQKLAYQLYHYENYLELEGGRGYAKLPDLKEAAKVLVSCGLNLKTFEKIII